MKNIDLEALKKATQALDGEQWYQDGTGTIWLAPSDPVIGPTDLSSAVLEVYLRTDEKDGDRQQFLALANPSAVLALIARVERAEDSLLKLEQTEPIAWIAKSNGSLFAWDHKPLLYDAWPVCICPSLERFDVPNM